MRLAAMLLLFATPPVPGRVDPTVTREQLCSESTRLRRHVTRAMRKAIYVRDGADGGAALFETDHLVPLELGGANTPDNLWAEPWPDAHLKDKRENFLHRAACRGEVELAAAQAEMMAWGRDAGHIGATATTGDLLTNLAYSRPLMMLSLGCGPGCRISYADGGVLETADATCRALHEIYPATCWRPDAGNP